MIEHPAGESKQVSRVDCKVQGVDLIGRSTDKTDFGHTCDTLGGSSGSPVLDPAHLEVVGLHHLAVTTAGVVVNQAVNINLIKAKCGAACATP